MRHYYTYFAAVPKGVRLLFLRLMILLCRPFASRPRAYNLLMKMRLLLTFEQAVKAGDVTIQSGVDLSYRNSFLLHERMMIGREGHAHGVEPDPRNIALAGKTFAREIADGRITVTEAALSNEPGVMKINFGSRSKWNKLEHIAAPDVGMVSPVDGENITYTDDDANVTVMTIDGLVEAQDIDPARVGLLSLQINGSEYDALRGAEQTLRDAKHLTVLVATGRQFEGSLGTIDGAPDYETIGAYLKTLGYHSSFCRMWNDGERFGFLAARRDTPPPAWHT